MYLGPKQNHLPEQPFFTVSISRAKHLLKTDHNYQIRSLLPDSNELPNIEQIISNKFWVGWLVLWINF